MKYYLNSTLTLSLFLNLIREFHGIKWLIKSQFFNEIFLKKYYSPIVFFVFFFFRVGDLQRRREGLKEIYK